MAQTTQFGPLTVAYDGEVLQPRAWTLAQADWAVALSDGVPDGAVLELCAGVGQIGLVVAARTGRRLVQVDVEERAVELARANAERAGLADRVEVRRGDLAEAVAAGESYPLVLADPPYVPSDDTAEFEDDPTGTIDGGDDGLAVVRQCLDVADAHLEEPGLLVLQLRDEEQAARVAALVGDGAWALAVRETRVVGDGALVLLSRPAR